MLNELARLSDLRPSDRKAPPPTATGVVVATPAPPLREVSPKLPLRAAGGIDASPAAVVSIRVELLRQQPPAEVIEAAAEPSVRSEPDAQPAAAGPFDAQAFGRAAAAYSFQRSLAEPTALAIAPFRRLDVRA